MKIKKVWINKDGAPMVSRNGWPGKHPVETKMTRDGKETTIYWGGDVMRMGKAMDQAKRDAVPLIGWSSPDSLLPDTFIDADFDVEFIARVVPEKSENGSDYIDPERESFESGLDKTLNLEQQLAAANQTIDDLKRAIIDGTNIASGIGWDGDKPEIEKVREQLAAAQARVKELEDYLADRITAPTKSMIIEAFHKKWAHDPDRDLFNALGTVLDELGIE